MGRAEREIASSKELRIRIEYQVEKPVHVNFQLRRIPAVVKNLHLLKDLPTQVNSNNVGPSPGAHNNSYLFCSYDDQSFTQLSFETSSATTMSAEKALNPKEKLEAQIKSADMTEDMQQEAIDVAEEGMTKFSIEKDIAQFIKKTFDERKGPTWHCIVGRNFGSFVTHETKHFIYFYLGHCAILLFKTQ